MMGTLRMNRIYATAIVKGTPEDFGGIQSDEEQKFWDEVNASVAAQPNMQFEVPFEPWDMDDVSFSASSDPAEWGQEVDDGEGDGVEKSTISLVSKSTAERRFTLGPMYIPDTIDAHNEWTDADELQKAVWDYVRKDDRRIRLQHNRDVVAGEWVEIMTFPYPMSVPMAKANGDQTEMTFPKDTVFLGVIWEPWAWDLVKSGKLRGYSIGGKAERLYADLPDKEN